MGRHRLAHWPGGQCPICCRLDGPDAVAIGGGVPRRGARLAAGQPPRARARGWARRGDGLPHRVAAQAARRRLGRDRLAEGVRRPRRDPDRAGDLGRRGDPPGGAEPGQRAGAGDGRTGGHRPRHRGAEGALSGADPDRRGDLVPGLLGARVGVRPRLAEDAGGQGRRRMGRHRAEGVDDLRPVREVVHARRPHRPRRTQAPGPDLLPDGHGAGGGRSQAAGPDHRRGRVQRGLHQRGADPGRERRSAASGTGGASRSRR